MENGTTEKILSPNSFSSGKVWWSDTNRTTLPVVSCGQDSQDTKHVSRWALSPPYVQSYQLSSFSAWFDQLIKCCHISIPPSVRNRHDKLSQRTRIVQGLPLFSLDCLSLLWIMQVPVQGTKVSPLLWEHSTLQLLKYSAHLHTIPGFADASQIPEQRKVFKANVVLAFNKEKGRLFSLNSLRLLQAMELLPTCCTQQLRLPLTRDVHKKAKPWQ